MRRRHKNPFPDRQFSQGKAFISLSNRVRSDICGWYLSH